MNGVTSTSADASWSVRRVLAWATDDFRRRGTESPRLEAELLLSHVLGLDRVGLIVQAEKPLSAEELGRARELIKRRRSGEPIAYILGEREFYGLGLRVDARVLVPRPDTETLVEVALDRSRERSMRGTMLDLCTGSGCVAIAFAKKRPTWDVTASDVSEGALEVARQNAERTGAVRNLTLRHGSLFDAVAEQTFDVVTANPPYIPSGEIPELPPDVRDFEPRLALDGGPDGLTLMRQLVAHAPRYLTEGGVLAVEMALDQGAAVTALFEAAGFADVTTTRDLGGRDRVVSGVRR